MQTEIDKLRRRNELVPYTGTRTTALVQFRPPPVEMPDVQEVEHDED
jgi:MerR family transcriptional regulator/heat shock protein HspR